MNTQESSLSLGSSASVGGSVPVYGPIAVSFSASVSSQMTRTRSNTEERKFSMEVFVRVEQNELPAGMEKILKMLEDAVHVQHAVKLNSTATR